MVYAYKCPQCSRAFDIVKSVRDIDLVEACPTCETPAIREFVPKTLHLSKTGVKHAEFNPGLGTVVKNDYHKRELLKQKGLVEIGNDFGSGNKQLDHFEKVREEKKTSEWEKI